MAVNLKCPNLKCRKILKVPDSMRGKRVCCSYCKLVFKIPEVKKYFGKPPEKSEIERLDKGE